MVTWRLKAGEEDRSYSSSISAKDIDGGGSEGAGQEGRKQAGGGGMEEVVILVCNSVLDSL